MEMGSSSSPSDSLNGLKFGQKIYFEDVGFGAPVKSGGESSSSLSTAYAASGKPSPTKKGKNGVVQARCQVEGCKVDLSDAKAYYSRHKVCGTHSKSPVVTVAGLEQRFCQQCSRFHQLPEFDQGKRSCRRRLAGHNERRRKPPPGSLSSSRYGRLSSSIFEASKDGGFVMDFSTFPRFTGRDPWPTTRASSDQVSDNQSTPTGKFFSHPWPSQPENPPPSDLFLQGSTNGTHYSGSMIPSGECFAGASDSVCALSLLSNQPWDQRVRPTSLGVNHFTLNADCDAPMVQSTSTHGSAVNHFSSPPWGFKGHDVGTSSHNMAPDLGLSHISHSGNSPYSSEFESTEQTGRQYAMELEHSREPYGSFTQHVHWPL